MLTPSINEVDPLIPINLTKINSIIPRDCYNKMVAFDDVMRGIREAYNIWRYGLTIIDAESKKPNIFDRTNNAYLALIDKYIAFQQSVAAGTIGNSSLFIPLKDELFKAFNKFRFIAN